MLVTSEHGDVMRDGISIRRHTSIRTQELVALSPELDKRVSTNRLPLHILRVRVDALHHLLARGTQQEWVIGRHQVEIVHALEPNGILPRHELHAPDDAVGILTLLLRHGPTIVVGP